MLTIHKYTIVPDDYVTIDMPKDSQVLTVDIQFGTIQLWVLVNPMSEMIERTFRLAGTGHPIKEDFNDLNYINTFQMHGGSLAFHLFEVFKKGG